MTRHRSRQTPWATLALLGALLCLTGCDSQSGRTAPAPSGTAHPPHDTAAPGTPGRASQGATTPRKSDEPSRDPSSGTHPGTTVPGTPAGWDLSTGAYAPDRMDTAGWLPLTIDLDTLSVRTTSPRLAIQAGADDITTVLLDGRPVVTLTRARHGLTIRATPGDIHLAYVLTGTGTTPLTLNSDNAYRLVLADAHLSSTDGPALHLQSPATAFIELQGHSTLADAPVRTRRTDAQGEPAKPRGALSAAGPLVIRGDGALSIDATAHHALATAGHLRLSSGNLTLKVDTRDGLRPTQAFIMDGGRLTIDAPSGKGIKVSGKESAVQPLGFVAVNDGHITIRSHDKGITTGWKPWRDAHTPSTDDDPDPRITINGGTIDITTTGTPARDTDDEGDNSLSPEGIEAKSVLNVRGGNLKVITTDDSISAGMHLELSGGRTYAYSSHDDAVDSNGTLTIAGGVLVAISHAPRPEGALDSDSNRFAITGGTFVGIGAYSSTPTDSACTQNVITIPTYVEAGPWTLRDAAGNVVFSYDLPFRSGYMIASTSALARGATYTVVRGGTLGPVGEDFHGLALHPTTLTGGTPAETFTITRILTPLGAAEFDWFSPEKGPDD